MVLLNILLAAKGLPSFNGLPPAIAFVIAGDFMLLGNK